MPAVAEVIVTLYNVNGLDLKIVTIHNNYDNSLSNVIANPVRSFLKCHVYNIY